MAPSNENELSNMIATAAKIDYAPCSFRYPRGEGNGTIIEKKPEILKIGKGRIIQEGTKVAILSFGTKLNTALNAAKKFNQQTGYKITVADARFAKPLDGELISTLAKNHSMIITIEEGSIGGFGAHVLHYLNKENLLNRKLKVRNLFYPDRFLEQSTQALMDKEAHLNEECIYKLITDEFKTNVLAI